MLLDQTHSTSVLFRIRMDHSKAKTKFKMSCIGMFIIRAPTVMLGFQCLILSLTSVGDRVKIILTDYAQTLLLACDGSHSFFDSVAQLSKYRSCGLWFEPLQEGQKQLHVTKGDFPSAKINKKVVSSNNR